MTLDRWMEQPEIPVGHLPDAVKAVNEQYGTDLTASFAPITALSSKNNMTGHIRIIDFLSDAPEHVLKSVLSYHAKLMVSDDADMTITSSMPMTVYTYLYKAMPLRKNEIIRRVQSGERQEWIREAESDYPDYLFRPGKVKGYGIIPYIKVVIYNPNLGVYDKERLKKAIDNAYRETMSETKLVMMADGERNLLQSKRDAMEGIENEN